MQASWKRAFFTISIGQLASMVGSSAVQFSLIWWISSETGSALMLGLSGLVAFVPATLLSPVAGIVADRYDRKLVCILADLFIGLCAAVFSILLWRYDLPVWSALLILFMRSMGEAFHEPAFQAMVPQFVPSDELVKVGGWNQMVMSGSFLLGPAIGAALYAAFPLPVLLLTDLLCALIASAMLALAKVAPMERVEHEKRDARREFREGVEVFKADKALTLITATQVITMIFYVPLASFYPLMSSDHFQATAWHASAVEVLYALGMMISAFVLGNLLQVKRHLLVSYLGLLGVGLTAGIGGLLPPTMQGWVIFALVCGLMGVASNFHGIPLIAYMQTTIAPEKMGRAFSLVSLAASVSMPIGLIIASPVAETIGVAHWFWIAGIGTCSLTLLSMALHKKLGYSFGIPNAESAPE